MHNIKCPTIIVNSTYNFIIEMVGEPYIKLRLSSVCQASDKHWKTKPIKGMQKSPIFNEDIKLYVVLVASELLVNLVN